MQKKLTKVAFFRILSKLTKFSQQVDIEIVVSESQFAVHTKLYSALIPSIHLFIYNILGKR